MFKHLTQEEIQLIQDELHLDPEHPTTKALVKLVHDYNRLVHIYESEFSASDTPPLVDGYDSWNDWAK